MRGAVVHDLKRRLAGGGEAGEVQDELVRGRDGSAASQDQNVVSAVLNVDLDAGTHLITRTLGSCSEPIGPRTSRLRTAIDRIFLRPLTVH